MIYSIAFLMNTISKEPLSNEVTPENLDKKSL